MTSLKDFPECKDCEVFQKFLTHPDRALACETARAIGKCVMMKWKEEFEGELRKELAFLEEKEKEVAWQHQIHHLKGQIHILKRILGDTEK